MVKNDPLRVWIDSDPALGVEVDGRPRDVDDAFVIVEALRNPRVALAGISVVFGNAPVDDAFEVANDLVRRVGSPVAVARGAAAPAPPGADSANEAARAMADALRDGPLSVLAIGPLTNLAALVRGWPERARAVREVVIVAGRSRDQVFRLHGATGIPDFNFESDVEAARALLESGVPIRLAGFELTHRVVVTRAQLEAARGRSEVARHLVEGALPWLAFWQSSFPDDPGFHPWDSAALACLLHPEDFVSEARGWRIRTKPDEAPGAAGTPWLECDVSFPGERVTYVPDFSPGGARAFVERIGAAIR